MGSSCPTFGVKLRYCPPMLVLLLTALTPVATPAASDARTPGLSVDGDRVHLVWFEDAPEGHRLRTATLEGDVFGPASTVRAGGDFIVNWADTPSIVRGGDGALWVHWPQRSGPAKYAYDVRLARSEDGRTWETRGAAHDDGTQTEHGFPSMWPAPGGVEAVWLDGRQTLRGGPMTLRWGRFGAKPAGERVDERVCDCCGTSASGGLVAYRDRAHGEIRDVRVARRDAGGWRSVSVHDDGWRMPGCPVNGPAIRADGSRVVVAWFTGAGGGARVRAAFSADGARSFGAPIDIDTAAPLGRVDVALAPDGAAVVAWLARDETRAALRVRRVHPSGRIGAALTLATTAATRAAGFPRMVRRGGDLVVAWTHCGASCGGLRVGRLPLTEVPAATAVPQRRARGGGPPARRPDYAAPDLSGARVALRPERTLVSLWATWCGPCRGELETLARLQPKHPGLRILAIAVDDDADAVRAFTSKHPLPFTVLHDRGAQSTFVAAAVPATRLYDASGTLLWWHDGRVDDAALHTALSAHRE